MDHEGSMPSALWISLSPESTVINLVATIDSVTADDAVSLTYNISELTATSNYRILFDSDNTIKENDSSDAVF